MNDTLLILCSLLSNLLKSGGVKPSGIQYLHHPRADILCDEWITLMFAHY